jgi:hypothetical protein
MRSNVNVIWSNNERIIYANAKDDRDAEAGEADDRC